MKFDIIFLVLTTFIASVSSFVIQQRQYVCRSKICFDDNLFYLKSSEQSEEIDSQLRLGIETAWRYVSKPLLRIGGKGVADSHGNSLKELLNAHTVVKVKINSDKNGSLEDIFETLKTLLEKNGGMTGTELIHIRSSENTILIGKEGTMDKIREGSFPPSA